MFLKYTNDLSQSLSGNGSYLYADGMHIFYQDKDIHPIEDVLTKEFETLCKWSIDNNPSVHFGDD